MKMAERLKYMYLITSFTPTSCKWPQHPIFAHLSRSSFSKDEIDCSKLYYFCHSFVAKPAAGGGADIVCSAEPLLISEEFLGVRPSFGEL